VVEPRQGSEEEGGGVVDGIHSPGAIRMPTKHSANLAKGRGSGGGRVGGGRVMARGWEGGRVRRKHWGDGRRLRGG
jgi:hypothetical protein